MSILIKALNKNNQNDPKTLAYNGQVLFCISHRSLLTVHSFKKHSVMTEDSESCQ